ncbi:HNH endonuclease [Gleimia hominis]|uniref:HNH endonuclease n=1 Tax=Gleimia hominis TaxID=595468 RepID=UPI001E38A2E3|nr:HNH endonuclease [Gleimia hominis]WIK64731.1 HNH endonuclease [Gleimia hominis]
MKPIVDAWRAANPHIVGLWADVEEAAIAAITSRQPIRLRNLRFGVESGILFIQLPSGMRLAHVLPLEHGGTHDFENLRALCEPRHSQQTALDDDRWRRTPRFYSY